MSTHNFNNVGIIRRSNYYFSVTAAFLYFVLTVTIVANGQTSNILLQDVSPENVIDISTVVSESQVASQPVETTIVAPSVCRKFGGDVWELSTRHLSCPANVAADDPRAFDIYHVENNSWVRSNFDAATFRTSDALPIRTIVYVHGNFMDRGNARERVQLIDRYIARRAREPYRILMISWASQHNEPLLRDVQENAKLADANAKFAAHILRVFAESHTELSMLGFSLGARTVTIALHQDAQRAGEHMQHRVSLVAPAVDRDWILPRGRYAYSMTNVEKMVNLYNSRDPILRRFRFIDSFSRPIAAGFTGFEAWSNPRASGPLSPLENVFQYDCSSSIGSTHSERSYYGECAHFQTAIDNLLGK